MAWEDRTPAEKQGAQRDARDYARTDDHHTYAVVTERGTNLTVHGIHSARATAGRHGTYHRQDEAAALDGDVVGPCDLRMPGCTGDGLMQPDGWDAEFGAGDGQIIACEQCSQDYANDL